MLELYTIDVRSQIFLEGGPGTAVVMAGAGIIIKLEIIPL
jgi:hypothetical protein